jgi:hypothetical protein
MLACERTRTPQVVHLQTSRGIEFSLGFDLEGNLVHTEVSADFTAPRPAVMRAVMESAGQLASC